MINILTATKCRPMILVSRNIKYMQIFAGVPSVIEGVSPSAVKYNTPMMFEYVEAYVAVCCYSHNYWLCLKSTSDQCAESNQLKFVQNEIRAK